MYASTSKNKNDVFSQDLIHGLDLIPLVDGIAAHAGTKRGRMAILSWIGGSSSKGTKEQRSLSYNKANSGPRSRLRVSSSGRSRNDERSILNAKLAPLATSAQEAREEYELTEQALLALNSNNNINFIELCHPPIYGADSSPWDTQKLADTDHDEWMFLTAGDQASLEHVLQAEQVITMLLQVKEWSQRIDTETWIPMLSNIGKTIKDDVLLPIQQELHGAVEIARVKSLTDPNGRSTFCFRLNESKFPVLKDLRKREEELANNIDTAIKAVLRKQKGSPESADFEGRKVLLLPKGSVTDFGIVRGSTENGRGYYVEPRNLVTLGDELKLLRDELKKTETIIEHQLIQTILNAVSPVDAGMNAVARLDVVFSKAAFGMLLNGIIPKVGENGRINVNRFVHPVLALQVKGSVVPVDLRLYSNTQSSNRALIISGPNGGGKSLVMKSFGLVCLHVKMALPIPSAAPVQTAVVDYFENVVIEMGDQQNVAEGESTFMARLNCLSSVIQRLQQSSADGNGIEQQSKPSASLVLLDELGGGTDPVAGGAIAQAVLEKLLESGNCRIVVTTHSPRLKALSYSNDDYDCATVLLRRSENSDFKLPTYQLQYGLIGDSYALGAASRAIPSLPDDVLTRAATLLSTMNSPNDGDGYSGELLLAMTDSLEKQIQLAEDSRQHAEEMQRDAMDCRDAMIALSNAYVKQLATIEDRLENVFKELQADASHSNLDVVGETLATVRTIKKKVKTEDEQLQEKGLKRVSLSYELRDGESVVIIAPGDREGTSGTIIANGNGQCKPGEVLVVPSPASWEDPFFPIEDRQGLDPKLTMPLILRRDQIAVWDVNSLWDDESIPVPTTSVRESRQRLTSLLSTLSSSSSQATPNKSAKFESSSFTSSRQRKSTASALKKKKK